MNRRLDESEAARVRARDIEMADRMSLVHMEARRHAETASVLAQAKASLEGIPNEVRLVAESQEANRA